MFRVPKEQRPLGLKALTKMVGSATAIVAALGLAALGFLRPELVLAHDPVASVGWKRDVEPIVRARCLSCHQPGGAALPTLASYEDFKLHRAAVKAAVLSRRMPVWAPVRGFGSFRDDRSLSPIQISLIASWIESGAPASKPDGNAILAGGTPPPPDRGRDPRRVVTLELSPFTESGDEQRTLIDMPATLRGAAVVGWKVALSDPTVRSVEVHDQNDELIFAAAPDLSAESFPAGTGFRVRSNDRWTARLSRRTRDADGSFRPAKRTASLLELTISDAPIAELRSIRARCGGTTPIVGSIQALRPESVAGMLPEVRIRSAKPEVLALFRPPIPIARNYWLSQPVSPPRNAALDVVGRDCAVVAIVSVGVVR